MPETERGEAKASAVRDVKGLLTARPMCNMTYGRLYAVDQGMSGMETQDPRSHYN